MARRGARQITGIAAAVSLLAGIAVGVASASPADVARENVRTWFDAETGVLDLAKAPGRIGFATDLAPGGIVWVDTEEFAEKAMDPSQRYTAYAERSAGLPVGDFRPSDGTIRGPGGELLIPRADLTPVTTANGDESR